LNVTGTPVNISGYAEILDPKYPGRLTVHLDGIPFDAPYWITNLGPVVQNQYNWAIVTDWFCVDLFVLSRVPVPPQDTIILMQAAVTKLGYNIETDWVPTPQEGCPSDF